MAIKILFFHFDLGNGGAERVLVNLANALDRDKYDITVMTLFNHGVNKDLLNSNIRRQWVFDFAPISGINKLLTLFSPRLLHKLFIKENYDYLKTKKGFKWYIGGTQRSLYAILASESVTARLNLRIMVSLSSIRYILALIFSSDLDIFFSGSCKDIIFAPVFPM